MKKNNRHSSPRRSRWYASLKAKVILLVAGLSLIGFSLQFASFLYVENEMADNFEEEKMSIIEDFVSNTLKPIMLLGRAAELMPILAENYKSIVNTRNLHIIRTDGMEAFSDGKTIKSVNDFLGYDRFKREKLKRSKRLLSENDRRLKTVLSTRKRLVYKTRAPDGTYLMNMMIPFINESQCRVCHGSDHEIRGLMLVSFSTSKHERRIINYIYALAGLVMVSVILISGAILLLFNKFVINPIANINGKVNDIVENQKFDDRIKVNSNDEVGDLAAMLNYFISSVEDFRIEQAQEKDRLEKAVMEKTRELVEKNAFIEKDLKLAGRIQKRLLPEKFPETPNIRFHAAYLPCLYIGGDYYDVFEMPDKNVGVFMVDASGHGTSAALLVSIVKAITATLPSEIPSPGYVIDIINKILAKITPDDSFVTIFYGIINTETGKMSYSLAGHPAPIIFNAHTKDLQLLDTNGGLVGVFDFDRFGDAEYYFKPGDRMLAYTDGLVEAQNDDREQFGQERIIAILKENADLPTGKVTGEILKELNKYTGGTTQTDDVAMVVLDYEVETVR